MLGFLAFLSKSFRASPPRIYRAWPAIKHLVLDSVLLPLPRIAPLLLADELAVQFIAISARPNVSMRSPAWVDGELSMAASQMRHSVSRLR